MLSVLLLVTLISLFLFVKGNDDRSFFVTTVPGLENVLEGEIKQLQGVSKISKGKGGVSFSGSTATGLEALLWLRSSLKVIEVIGSTDSGVDDKDDLYAFCQSLSWQSYLTSALTFKIETTFGQVAPAFNHQLYTSLTVKHAITDGWSKGTVPLVSLDDPDVNIFLYLHRGSAIVYRVWSGDTSLHKRGYREVVHKAALRETTAAALLLAAGWRTPKSVESSIDSPTEQPLLCDPMCGSATFLLEAALILADVAPGLIRYSPEWGQPHPIIWPDLVKENTREQWKEHVTAAQGRDRRQALAAPRGGHKLLHGNDVNANAIQLAARSAELAGVDGMISLSTTDVDRLGIPPPRQIVTNPPWDLRLDGGEDAWRKLDSYLRQGTSGSGLQTESACVLSGSPALLKHLSWKPSSNLAFTSSNVEMRFVKYVR